MSAIVNCETSHISAITSDRGTLTSFMNSSKRVTVEGADTEARFVSYTLKVPRSIDSVEESGFTGVFRDCLVPFRLSKGETFCEYGSTNCAIPILRKGLFVVEVPYPNGEYFPTQFITPQRAFAPSHGPGYPAPFKIWALADCEGVSISHEAVYAVAQQFPTFGFAVISSMMQRLNDQYQAHARLNHMPLGSQLAYLFCWLVSTEPWLVDTTPTFSTKLPRRKLIPWKIPQKMLADFFGVPREEISRKLSSLEKQGFLYRSKEGYVLFESLESQFAEYGAITQPVELFASVLSA